MLKKGMLKEPFFLNGSVFVFFFVFFKVSSFHLDGYASALVEAGGAIESYTIHL